MCSRMKINFMAFFRMNIDHFYRLSNCWERKYENKTTIAGRFYLKNDLQFLRYVL